MSKVVSLAFKDKNTAGLNTLAPSRGTTWGAGAAYLLWNNSVVVLQNEPLNVLRPQALLFHRLSLKPAIIVMVQTQ